MQSRGPTRMHLKRIFLEKYLPYETLLFYLDFVSLVRLTKFLNHKNPSLFTIEPLFFLCSMIFDNQFFFFFKNFFHFPVKALEFFSYWNWTLFVDKTMLAFNLKKLSFRQWSYYPTFFDNFLHDASEDAAVEDDCSIGESSGFPDLHDVTKRVDARSKGKFPITSFLYCCHQKESLCEIINK